MVPTRVVWLGVIHRNAKHIPLPAEWSYVRDTKRVRPLDQSTRICCEADSSKRRPTVSVLVVEAKTNSKTTPKILRIVTPECKTKALKATSRLTREPTQLGSFEVFLVYQRRNAILGLPHRIHGYTMQIQVRSELVLYRRTTRKRTNVRNCEVHYPRH